MNSQPSLELIEQGPIRPPSEAGSLFLRLTRGCPWNRCAFCGTYRGIRYSPRSVDDVIADIDRAADWSGDLRSMSAAAGFGGALDGRILGEVSGLPGLSRSAWDVAVWSCSGEGTVFLQDADALALPARDVAGILRHLKERFPSVSRVTSYCRSRTASRKDPDEFRLLAEAGLRRVHVGLESGSDAVLAMASKGVTSADHLEAGANLKAAGLSLCVYVMPGLGGRKLSREHAVETARVVGEIDPDFIRLRTLAVAPTHDLMRRAGEGGFEIQSDDETIREIRLFIESLPDVRSEIVSDHILNLLEGVEGRLPEDRGSIINAIDSYLGLDEDERVRFRLGRRLGILRLPSDLRNPVAAAQVDFARRTLCVPDSAAMDRLCLDLTARFI